MNIAKVEVDEIEYKRLISNINLFTLLMQINVKVNNAFIWNFFTIETNISFFPPKKEN